MSIYISGGEDKNYNQRDEIMAWSEERQEWEEGGKMKGGRTNHAITTISMEEVADICGLNEVS